MKAVKTYRYVMPAATQVSFDIKRMEDIYDQNAGVVDEPHRHEYYILLLVKQAKGIHRIDFETYPLQEKQAFFISPGQVHQLIEEEQSFGWALTFNQQFMAENGIDACFLEDINLFQDYGKTPPLLLSVEQETQLHDLATQVYQWKQSNAKFKDQAIGALLKLMLIMCNNICVLDQNGNTQQVQAGMSILRDFKHLVEQHFKQEHQVSFYAKALFVTPDHLNRTIKSLIGKTAKEYIQTRILIAAKRFLHFSDFSAKEIAFALGFSEPTYFSHFFKNRAGQSITAFRSGPR